MKILKRNHRILICTAVIASLILAPISAHAGQKRVWVTETMWEDFVGEGGGELQCRNLRVGEEGKLSIECWEDKLSADGKAIPAAPYQMKVFKIEEDETNSGLKKETLIYSADVISSDDENKGYYKLFEFTGLSEGEYRFNILIKSNAYFHVKVGSYKLVNVAPNYQEITDIAKSLATKNIPFKSLKQGKEARLYGKEIKFKDKNGKYSGTLQPSVIMEKNGESSKLYLDMAGSFSMYSSKTKKLSLNKIRFYTSDRKVSYTLNKRNESYRRNPSKSTYTASAKLSSTFSTTEENNNPELSQLIYILSKKNVSVQILGKDGKVATFKLTESQRKNWLSVFKKYNKMMREYWSL